jgi:hypothetical protein
MTKEPIMLENGDIVEFYPGVRFRIVKKLHGEPKFKRVWRTI